MISACAQAGPLAGGKLVEQRRPQRTAALATRGSTRAVGKVASRSSRAIAAGSTSGAAASAAAPAAASSTAAGEREVRPGIYEGYWTWQGHRIRYQRSGDAGPPVLCVHG